MMLSRMLHRLRPGRVADRFGATAQSPAHSPHAAGPQDGGWPDHAPSAAPQVATPASVRAALAEAFTPTRPQAGSAPLVGRRAQLTRILGALREERAHVVLYGERGRGKTSLANLVTEVAGEAGLVVARVSCAAETEFDSMLRGLARDLPRALLHALPIRDLDATEGCEAALPPGRLQPRDVLALARGGAPRLVLVIDEFDRVTDEATRTRLADTIKLVSDAGAALSFFVVGVSDSLDQLLGRHPSIQRNIVGVPLPLLGAAEVEEIVARGAHQAGLDFPPSVCAGIAVLARGVPYLAQLLGLRAGQAALDRRDRVVSGVDLARAVAQVVEETDPRIAAQYEVLCDGAEGPAVRALLRAIATGEQTAFGQFRATPAADGWRVAGAEASPEAWERLLHAGAVRPASAVGPALFTFAEAAMPTYVLLRAVTERDLLPLREPPSGD